MAFFNYSTMQMTAKIVYYGPGLGGKTTNLQFIYGHTADGSRGEMVSLETQTDRTLFFDLLPMEVGTVAGFKTRIQLYTVPGQVFYNTTRKLVLKGVDGIVFVADSQRPMMQANVESLDNLEENLDELGTSLDTLPIVMQFNKRDLPEILPVRELEETLNRGDWPAFEASALTGEGVFETLRGISRLTLQSLKKQLEVTPGGVSAARTAAPAAPPRRPVLDRHDREPVADGDGVAAPPPSPPPGAMTREDSTPPRVRRDYLLRVPASDLDATRSLRLDVRLHGDDDRLVREAKTIRIGLDDLDGLADLLLQVNLALRSDDRER